MTGENFLVIKQLYYSLSGINKTLDTVKSHVVEKTLVDEYARFLQEANQKLPDTLRTFYKDQYHSHNDYYNFGGVKAHIEVNLGILRGLMEDVPEKTVIQQKDFAFISDSELKKILERDYLEIQRNMISGNWKSSIILSGGSIEAILLDLCLKNESVAKSSSKAPSGSINDWVLNDLIEISLDCKLVEPSIAKLSHSVREYRNLIHSAVELKNKLRVEPEEAKIAVEILNILIRDLS